jgi:hypothetical protein
MQTPSTFTGAGWDTSIAWELRSGQYPLLKQLLQPIFVIADNKTSTYNGSAFTAFTSTVSPTTVPGGAYTGTVTFTPSTPSPTNAGTYTVTPGGVSVTAPADQNGYRMQFVDGTLVIDPASLSTILDTTASKTYDGSNIFNNTHVFSFAGMINSDPMPTVTGGQATVSSPHAGTYDSFTSNTLTLSDANYTLTDGTVSATINPKAVTLTAPNVSKTYDGDLLYTTIAGDLTALSGQLGVGGDSVTAATIAYTDRNAGAGNKTVTFDSVTINDGNGGNNYTVTRQGNSTSTIAPKVVTLTAPNVSKTYDGGLTYATIAGDLTALSGQLGVSGDTISAATIAYTDRNAGTGNKTVTFDAATISDGNGGNNYDVTLSGNSTSTITPKAVTLTAPNISKIYDGGLTYMTVAGDLSTLSGQLGVSGDTVTAATMAYTDRNAGSGNKTVTLDAATISDGNGGNNYSVVLAGNTTSTITPKALSLLGITGVPSELTKPAGFSGGTVGQQFAIPTTLSGSPMLQTAIAAGTGTATDGKPYDIDGPFTFSGTPQANTWTVTASTATATDVTAPVTGLTLTGTGSANYTVTGTSVSSKIKPSAAVVVPQQQQVVNQVLATQEKPTTTTTRPTTTTTRPTTTTREPQTTTTAPPPAQVSATTSNPTPRPGEAVPITAPATGGQPSLDPSKPVAAVLVPASGDADVPMPTPTITQNADGTISVNVTVPTGTPPGVYIIAVVGTSASGQSKSIIVPVVVRRVVASAE